MTRTFVLDHKNLQREQKPDVPGWLTLAAYLGVGAIYFGMIFIVGAGLARLERLGGRPRKEEPVDAAPQKRAEEARRGGRARPKPA
jgi:hypothetical protein